MRNAIKADLRKKLSKAVFEVTKNTFYNSIPLDAIDNALRQYNCLLVQEDGTQWSGFFCGEKGRAQLEIANLDSLNTLQSNFKQYRAYDNVALVITWEKFPTGRYEIIAYVS